MSNHRALAAATLMLASSSAWAGTKLAVVVGMSTYPGMPPELQIPSAREDARALARFLEDEGGYDTVHYLGDNLATRDGLARLMIDVVGPALRPGDTLLWAFVGHGYGADFGDPYLALHEFSADDPEKSGLRLETFGPELAGSLVGVNLLVVTDASHEGAVGGIAMRGPSALSWPPMHDGVFLLSANGPDEVAPEGVFVPLLIDGLRGKADVDRDGVVTTDEVYRYLVPAIAEATGGTVHPAIAGTYDGDLAFASVPAAPPRQSAPLVVTGVAAPERVRQGWGGPLSYTLMGLGAVAAGGGGYAYLQGRKLCETGDDGLVCYESAAYSRWRLLSFAAYGVGGLFGLTGFGLAFVPVDGGGTLDWRVAF